MTSRENQFFVEELRAWFRAAKRNLPWREANDPYAVWISEVMLQQTQVAVVLDYYERWMQRFPTIQALAEAEVEEVLKLWEGLGYYSRARHLHATARALIAHHGGQLPCSKEALQKLKGLGPYTVGAILSFGFKQKAAAVDGNGLRVLARYFAIEEGIDKPKTLKAIWALAEELLPEEAPFEIVEGLIELGAMLCKKEPHCLLCPLKRGCQAYKKGIQKELPRKERKVVIQSLKRRVFVIEASSCYLLKKGEKGKVMADLYEFPYVESENASFPFAFPAVEEGQLEEVTHSFTRYRVTLLPSFFRAEECFPAPGYEWISIEKIGDLPFSSGHRKLLKACSNR